VNALVVGCTRKGLNAQSIEYEPEPSPRARDDAVCVSRLPFDRIDDNQHGRDCRDVLAMRDVRRGVERQTPRDKSVPNLRLIQETTPMSDQKPPRHPVVVHICPVCHSPQTRIQRKLNGEPHGATNYVCSRAGECVLGIDLAKVDTWVAV
jgi:hypothetical protein